MPDYRLTPNARADVRDIFVFGAEQFGDIQAKRYLAAMHETFARLANNPNIGRAAGDIAPQLRRHGFRTHVVFYRPTTSGILIVRIVHMALLTGNLTDDLA